MTTHAQPQPLTTAPGVPRRALARLAATGPLGIAAGLVGTAGLVLMVLVSLRIATAAASFHVKMVVPAPKGALPRWMTGPFRGLGSPLGMHELDRLLIVMAVLYLLVVVCARWLPAWVAIAGAVTLVAVFALAPPLFSTDIFNYVAYARMGVLHHINPYVHGAAAIPGDPSFRFSGHMWRHTPTAYGPLFTLFSYAFAGMGVGGAMWAFKGAAALAALGCGALIWACARRLGIRPVPAMLFFALNPLLLVYAIGGGHNDVLMALPLLAGALLILDGRPELGGAALMAAIAVKVTAGLVLPFVLVASSSRWRVLAGAAAAALVIGVAGYLAFGPHVLSMIDLLKAHGSLTRSVTSVPGYVGHVLGQGGLTPQRYHVLQILFGAGAVALLVFAWWKRNWLAAGAGALLLLLLTLGWMLPWYVVWVLPLAPLARRRWVLIGVVALTGVVLAIQVHIYDAHMSNELPLHAHVHSQPGLPGPRLLRAGG